MIQSGARAREISHACLLSRARVTRVLAKRLFRRLWIVLFLVVSHQNIRDGVFHMVVVRSSQLNVLIALVNSRTPVMVLCGLQYSFPSPLRAALPVGVM